MAYCITENCIGCGVCKRNCIVFAIAGDPKQLHRINAKRCIDCGVCGRVCPTQAVMNSSGQVMKQLHKSLWPKPQINIALCSACALCVEACTMDALRISLPAFKGDIRVAAELVDATKCVACGLCSRRCPLKAITLVFPKKEKEAVS